LNGVTGARRRFLGPEQVDDPVAGHRPSRLQQQKRQDEPLFGRSEIDRTTLGPRLDGAEDAELHPATSAHRRRRLQA